MTSKVCDPEHRKTALDLLAKVPALTLLSPAGTQSRKRQLALTCFGAASGFFQHFWCFPTGRLTRAHARGSQWRVSVRRFRAAITYQ